MPYTPLYRQTYDPGNSAGAGAIWADISVEPPLVQVRNQSNTGWDSLAGAIPTAAAPAFVLGTANVAGAATTYAPTNSTILVFDVTAPVTQAFGDAAAVGAATVAARRDHVHGMPANPVAYAAPALSLGTANAAGVAASAVRTDATILVFDATVPVTQAYGDAAATGVATVAARRDHKHGMPAAGGASGGTPALVLGTANTAGVAATFIRTDDTILVFDVTVPVTQAFADAAAVGVATTAARRDHKHGMMANPTPAFAAPAFTLGTANAAGAAATVVRSDATILVFDVTVPVTQAYSDAAATGVATTAARRDHKHGMPAVGTGLVETINFIVDGAGSVITTGVKGDIVLDFAGAIVSWTLLPDQSGSIQFDIWKDTYANYPPTVADTITASAKPLISAATKGQSSTLTGWTTAFSAGDTIRFNVDSVTTVTRCLIALKVSRT